MLDQVRNLLQTPEVIVQTWRAVLKQGHDVRESEVRAALFDFQELWSELFPAEQARIVELLMERVDLHPDALEITLKVDGLTSLCNELQAPADFRQAAE